MTSTRIRYITLLFAALLTVAPPAINAAVTTFNFEDQTATWDPPLPRQGALTSLAMSEGGLTATITRENGDTFDIVQNSATPVNQTKAPEFGLESLDPFLQFSSPTAMIVDFSQPIYSASVDMGDYGDDTDTLTLQAFSGASATGTLLGSAVRVLSPSGSAFTFATLSLSSASPIVSLRMIGGASDSLPPGPNSVFYDNLRVDTVPEPGVMELLVVGLIISAVASHLTPMKSVNG